MTVDDAATRTLSTGGRVALGWVDADGRSAVAAPTSTAAYDLLPPLRRRRRVRARIIGIPVLVVFVLAGAYSGAMLLWPLSSVEVTAKAGEAPRLSGAASSIAWPAEGEAAVGVDGFRSATSSDDRVQMASTAKLVTALVVLDRKPLTTGEQGPAYDFTFADRQEYWRYVSQNQSALNVPDDSSLTEYQMLQGMLMASASNYANRLATDAFGSVDDYASAANSWLGENGLDGITVTDASGYGRNNLATPSAMVALAEKAMENPVIAEIVGTKTAELPGAGSFENTNALLGIDGVVGLKTGSFAGYNNLIAAKRVDADGAPLTVFAAVTGQPTSSARLEETERLLDAVAAEAGTPSTLSAGTVVGEVTTAWGATSRLLTEKDASLLLWNGATAESTTSFDVDAEATAGSDAGTLTVTGPTSEIEVPVMIEKALPGPDAWWRLTHPVELTGIGG
ncbi:D-alanyl-D-alanine carboxypeptidase family protein [Microbacterium sp. 179-I 1D1 NHS]|uniref:D-alanyl-D-alanine carboxypeptidase family protein n=1 Tax=Microbacterium sp. 179-I 1D1 NHS TaxID=3374298 RepID=UPI003879B3AD